MVELLNKLELYFQGQYEVDRTEIQHGKRLTLKHLDQVVHVDLFSTGKVHVSGKDSTLKAQVGELVEGFRQDTHFFDKLQVKAGEAILITPEEAILQHVTKELFGFLPAHDRQALIAAFQILLSNIKLEDYSPVSMPVGRAYEGFLGEVFIKIGICTRPRLEDAKYNLMYALDSAEAKFLKAKVSTHEAKLEAAKQRLREFRHIQLHSQSSQFVQCRTRDEVRRFTERVLGDMQGLYDYFKNYFVP